MSEVPEFRHVKPQPSPMDSVHQLAGEFARLRAQNEEYLYLLKKCMDTSLGWWDGSFLCDELRPAIDRAENIDKKPTL